MFLKVKSPVFIDHLTFQVGEPQKAMLRAVLRDDCGIVCSASARYPAHSPPRKPAHPPRQRVHYPSRSKGFTQVLEIFGANEGGSHFMFAENPKKFNQVVLEFLA